LQKIGGGKINQMLNKNPKDSTLQPSAIPVKRKGAIPVKRKGA
jgi:hypothetical protein